MVGGVNYSITKQAERQLNRQTSGETEGRQMGNIDYVCMNKHGVLMTGRTNGNLSTVCMYEGSPAPRRTMHPQEAGRYIQDSVKKRMRNKPSKREKEGIYTKRELKII